jgi:hypothetical protein
MRVDVPDGTSTEWKETCGTARFAHRRRLATVRLGRWTNRAAATDERPG